MQVFVYEFVSGGGWLAEEGPPPASLATEGAAMRAALVADFAAAKQTRVVTTRDDRWPPEASQPLAAEPVKTHLVRTSAEERAVFAQLAAAADWTVVVAPESGGRLSNRAQQVVEAGGHLLSPSPELVRLASDKQQTARHFRRHGIPTPPGLLHRPGQPLPADDRFGYPALLKPLDGCGSQGLTWLADNAAPRPAVDGPQRLETVCPGEPVSVLAVLGPQPPLLLPGCRQRIAAPALGDFRYLGGALPLPPSLAGRAERLAADAVASLPASLGLVGLDLLLGPATNGGQDLVVEINPRCTTSYVGLRAACRSNLADVVLACAAGERPRLEWRRGHCHFTPDGLLTWLP